VNGIDRLLTLRAENDRAGARMLEAAPRFLSLAQRHIEGTAPRAVSGFNLFQTPRPIAERMARIVAGEVGPGARILEPSAGLGRLFEPFAELEELRNNWVMVEEARECYNAIKSAMRRADVRNRDFLSTTPAELGGKFDAVIMNPPFKQGRDIKHVAHAFDMLKAGGVLVSLCYNGKRQNAKLKPIAATWEELPHGSFNSEGTGASVALLTMRKLCVHNHTNQDSTT